MTLAQLFAELLALVTDHPELADLPVMCDDGEFEVQGIWHDEDDEPARLWLTATDGSES